MYGMKFSGSSLLVHLLRMMTYCGRLSPRCDFAKKKCSRSNKAVTTWKLVVSCHSGNSIVNSGDGMDWTYWEHPQYNNCMRVTTGQLEAFHRFAQQKLQNGGAESIEELFDLWRIEQPSPEEQAEIHAVIRQGLADIRAGRGRPAEDVMRDVQLKYNLPAE